MRNIGCLLALAVIFVAYTGNAQDLQSKLEAFCMDKDARIGVAVINGKDTVAVNGREEFPMMSVFKFPLALAVAQWIDSNGISFDDSVQIGVEALHEDTYSPMLKKYGRKPMKLTFRELMEWSLIESDNNSTDILITAIGGIDGLNRLLREMNTPEGIKIEATEDDMHRDNILSYLNSATPLAMAELFDRFNASMRNKSAAFREVASMLERCRTGEKRLPAPLHDAVIGHKTGTGFTLPNGRLMAINDCGYVNLPDGRSYAIAVFIADSGYDMAATEKLIADISEIVYEHVNE